MPRPPLRAVAIVGILIFVGLIGSTAISELYRISKVRNQYRLDDAVHSERAADPVNRMTAEEFLDPPFMKQYNLATEDYIDSQGRFAPTGVHWVRWSLETKTAAILMWRGRSDLSAWEIRRTIRLVDDYYSRNDQTVPVVKVVNATKTSSLPTEVSAEEILLAPDPPSTNSADIVRPASTPTRASEVAKIAFPSTVLVFIEDLNGQPLAIGSGFVLDTGLL
jgi:hypothetical protein